MFPLINEVQLWRENNPLKFSLILNECKINTLSMRKTESYCREKKIQLFNSRTFDREDYVTCLEDGLTVFDINPTGKAANEIREITNELLEFIK
jgi:cellulose biosynthesis protein BcsQ